MVLGIRSKSSKSVSIQVHYVIHIQEIKPWPPSQSLRSVQSVVLQWKNGDQNSGSIASGAGDGKIEFNKSFRISVISWREASKKNTHRDSFQKHCLEFYLYECQNDKAVKNQLLGSGTINLADYGTIKETTTISTLLNCKRSFRNSAQPFLYVNIQPFDIEGSSSSPNSSLLKELSLDKEESESISQSPKDEDIEIASFTDDDSDDISSSTSQTVRSSSETIGDSVKISKVVTKRFNSESVLPLETSYSSSHVKVEAGVSKQFSGIKSSSLSMVLSSDMGKAVTDMSSLPNFSVESVKVAASSKIPESIQLFNRQNITKGGMVKVVSSASYIPVGMQSKIESSSQPQATQGNSMSEEDSRRGRSYIKDCSEKVSGVSNTGILEYKVKTEQKEKVHEEQVIIRNKLPENKLVRNFSEDYSRRKDKLKSATLPLSRKPDERVKSILTNDKRVNVKSVKLPFDCAESYGLFSRSQALDQAVEINAMNGAHGGAACHYGTKMNDAIPNNKTQIKSEVEMLREELRETAALEVSLYSVVADHGSSVNKVHAPARRLSRFYFHANKVGSPATRANAAQSVVSGFVLVSKACGNDVPRLTFWFSNLILLRAIASKGIEKIQPADGSCINSECDGNGSIEGRHPPHEEIRENTVKYFQSWEDPQAFLVALEKVEAWIFSRIVESVWWQTLTPYMQSAATKSSISRKISGGRYSLGDQEQGSFSIDLWKRAFKDACERLCPLRAGGHECGCSPVIAKLVMEQLVKRLDVAMFNAILRESAEEMPTDPISDPISDPKVLPIPAGKLGFGAGAQLKNAIRNWSRWLSDLFGINESDSPEDKKENDDNRSAECETPFKAFHLLNALSDLMMLPFDMLADGSIRKEVCPKFGVPLIKRVLYNFVPDEFCPGPIPDAVLEALNTEDIRVDEGSIMSVPCTAASTFYSPPTAASAMGFLQEVGIQTSFRNGSSLLKKSYTSDDELDGLDFPLSAIGINEPSLAPKEQFLTVKGGRKVVRFELLREVWRDSE